MKHNLNELIHLIRSNEALMYAQGIKKELGSPCDLCDDCENFNVCRDDNVTCNGFQKLKEILGEE